MARKNDKDLKELGRNIKKLRIAKGMSTRQFAYEADIAHSAVASLEAGLQNPTYITLLRIAEALEVDLNTLTSGK